MARNEALLQISNLSVAHGQVQALRDVSIEVARGEIVALIGANGAGKTTLLETSLGINTPQSGGISFKGKSIAGLTPDQNVRNGLCLVPEGRGVFASMSVLDNLLLGAHHNMARVPENLERVYRWLPRLEERKNQIARTLSGGERQMLAIARALMSAPDLIMVDEPSLGLAPIIVNGIFDILSHLNEEGYTILLSEQNAYKSLKLAHRAYVLETGKVILSGGADDLLNDPAVQQAYIGV